MTQEEKQLLFKDLCARLPYKPHIYIKDELLDVDIDTVLNGTYIHDWLTLPSCQNITIKPYLRPMSSMTEEEAKYLFLLHNEDIKEWEILEVSFGDKYIDFKIDDGCCSFELHTIWYEDAVCSIESFDWLNKKGFDYRGLIPTGLALEAPKGMYNKSK